MNGQIYLYKVNYIIADGRIIEQYGLVAADDIPSALKKLTIMYQNLDSIEIKQLDCGPFEIDEETWLSLIEEI